MATYLVHQSQKPNFQILAYIYVRYWFFGFLFQTNCLPLPQPKLNFKFYDPWVPTSSSSDEELLLYPARNLHVLPPDAEVAEDYNNYIDNYNTLLYTPDEKLDVVRVDVPCMMCNFILDIFLLQVHNKTPYPRMVTKFITMCTSYNIATYRICSLMVNLYAPYLLQAMNYTDPSLGSSQICSLLVGEACEEVTVPQHEWTIQFPESDKPKLKESPLPEKLAPTFKVLHLSDIHFDPEYEEGTVANCLEPLCCRRSSTSPRKGRISLAGKWGAYEKCDTPKILLENFLAHVSKNHSDIDYIIWTGDVPAHDLWNQTRQDNLNDMEETVRLLYKYFPNTPIFPSIGNHETLPEGSFPPPWVDGEYSINWLYHELAKNWKQWLPLDTQDTFLQGAFYSVLIRPGFRLISLNTNYCYRMNGWLYANSTDPAKQLEWLILELQEAENKEEKVHLIGHIPPGHLDCLKQWSKNFHSIVNRFEDTIAAQFYGHTHADEFQVFYDSLNSSRAINLAYLSPSLTTFEKFNPAYRIYYVDGDHPFSTREVVDHETWYFDLELANLEKRPRWRQLYSARQTYKMKSLRPMEWSNLINRMVHDSELYKMFYKFYYRNSPVRPPCDSKACKLQLLCDLRSGRSHIRRTICRDLELALSSIGD